MALNLNLPNVPLPGPAGYSGDAEAAFNMLSQQALMNKMLELQNMYYRPNIESEIANRMAMTEGQKQKNLYYPQDIMSIIGNRDARTQGQQIENRYAPQRLAQANQQGEIDLRTRAGMNEANLRKAQQEADKQAIDLQTEDMIRRAEIDKKKAQAEFARSGGRGSTVNQDEKMLFNTSELSHPELKGNAQKVLEFHNALLSGNIGNFSDGSPMPMPTTSERLAAGRIAGSAYTARQREQQGYALNLEDLFKQGNKISNNAFKYASAAGKIKGGIAALNAQRGKDDPEYADYLKFTEQLIPAIVATILKSEGSSSTDQQKALAIKQSLPINALNNSKLAQKQWDFLQEVYQKIAKNAFLTTAEKSGSIGGSDKDSGIINFQIPGDPNIYHIPAAMKQQFLNDNTTAMEVKT